MNAKQVNLFTGELKDTRTRKQKKLEKAANEPTQAAMFTQREMGQFGVKARPQMSISTKTRLELAMQDLRTEEEREAALQNEVNKRTYKLGI